MDERRRLRGGQRVLYGAPDNTALRSVVLERIQEIPGVRATRTWLVFEECSGRGIDWER